VCPGPPPPQHHGSLLQNHEATQLFLQQQQIQKQHIQDLNKNDIATAADFFEYVSTKYASNACLESVHEKHATEKYTYSQVNERANIVAHWLHSAISQLESNFNERPSEELVIGFLMENRPDFITTWIGIAKLGYTVSCLNHFLGEVSWHVYISKAPYVIISSDQKPVWERTVRQLREEERFVPHCWVYEEHILPFISTELLSASTSRSNKYQLNNHKFIQQRKRHMTNEEPVFHIFTSGTTGRSKAARFSNRRFYGAGVTWATHMELTEKDNYYIPLPLFHGNGGVVAVAACMLKGCNMVIREKFSATNFLSDVREFNCTAMVYIGELWRYIHNQPVHEDDAKNPLRVIAGNGLRPEIWEAIVERFDIERVVEHYGQTEMIAAHPTINSYGKVGSCGFIPPEIWKNQNEDILVKYDVEKDEVYRDPLTGFCVRSPIGEPGECISILPGGVYKGYTNEESNQKKIYRNVFEEGDTYFRSGDLLRIDEHGFFFFVDRAGDTYRWKGENVSTGEVTKMLALYPNIQEVNVYGVRVPNHEGKAGMACIQLCRGDKFDAQHFFDFVKRSALPHYACPLFVRIIDRENPKTSTLKFQKFLFSTEGFDPKKVSDELYYADFKSGHKYERVNQKVYEKITNQEIRL